MTNDITFQTENKSAIATQPASATLATPAKAASVAVGTIGMPDETRAPKNLEVSNPTNGDPGRAMHNLRLVHDGTPPFNHFLFSNKAYSIASDRSCTKAVIGRSWLASMPVSDCFMCTLNVLA